MTTSARPIMTPREFGAEFFLSTSTVHEWLQRDAVPGAFRIGRRWYIRRAAVAAWLTGNEKAAESPAAHLAEEA